MSIAFRVARAAAVLMSIGLSASATAQGARLAGKGSVPPELSAAIQAVMDSAGYDVIEQPRAACTAPRWLAMNPAQGLRTTFDAQAVSVDALDARTEPSLLTLQLTAWGRAGALQPPAPAAVVVAGGRVEYRRGPLVEWYVNERRGLEQGFTIEAAPRAGDPHALLELQLALGGRLSCEMAQDGRGLALRDEHGAAWISYAQLAAWDAEGRPLAARMELSGGQLSLLVDTAGAAWPITVDPLIASEQAQLTVFDAAPGDSLGYSVALAGDTAVVGAISDDHAGGTNAGSAYVFVRSGTIWFQQAKLTASDAADVDLFGDSVAIFADTVVVGAYADDHAGGTNAGSAYVFVRSGTTWTEQARLTASDAADFDLFGTSVALAGDTALIGSNQDDHAGGINAGSAYVFVRSGTIWSEQAKLLASDAAENDIFGFSVSLSGDTALVGAYGDDHAGGTDAGSAYVFVRSGTSWSQQQRLSASGAAASDFFGCSVALSGATAVVGAYGDDHAGGTDAGSAFVFVRSGTSWTQQAMLVAPDAEVNDNFGFSVALSDNTAVVAANGDDHTGGIDAGAAYLFARSGASWSLQDKLTASDAAASDSFGTAVALSDDTALVGASGDNLASGADAGSAHVFAIEVTPWTDLGSGLAGIAGIPALVGTGSLMLGTPLTMSLTSAAPSALTILFLSTTSSPVALKGGTLIPVPPLFALSLATNASGEILIPFAAWPPGASGLSLYFQYAIMDAGAVQSVALSNALRADVP